MGTPYAVCAAPRAFPIPIRNSRSPAPLPAMGAPYAVCAPYAAGAARRGGPVSLRAPRLRSGPARSGPGPGPEQAPAPSRPRPRPPARPGHEVPVQGGASVRETSLRGREDPEKVPGPSPGDRGKGAQSPNWGPGQEEIPGALRPDSGAVLFPDPEADPPARRGRALLLRQQRHPPHQRHHGTALPGAPRGGFLPLHRLQRRERLRGLSAAPGLPPRPLPGASPVFSRFFPRFFPFFPGFFPVFSRPPQ